MGQFANHGCGVRIGWVKFRLNAKPDLIFLQLESPACSRRQHAALIVTVKELDHSAPLISLRDRALECAGGNALNEWQPFACGIEDGGVSRERLLTVGSISDHEVANRLHANLVFIGGGTRWGLRLHSRINASLKWLSHWCALLAACNFFGGFGAVNHGIQPALCGVAGVFVGWINAVEHGKHGVRAGPCWVKWVAIGWDVVPHVFILEDHALNFVEFFAVNLT